MMFTQPSHYALVCGHSEGFSPLNAFDQALLKAGVGDTNIVRMSSILPPSCIQFERFDLPYGALVPVAYAEMISSQKGAIVSAAVSVAIPLDPALPGLIMEHHALGSLEDVEAHVREMALQGMAYRNREVREVLSIGAEHCVECHGAAFAGVVLWNLPAVM